MKLKTVFAFVTGASVGSAITVVEIGKAIGKNDIAKQALADSIAKKVDDLLFGGKTPEYKFIKTQRDRVSYAGYFNKTPEKEKRPKEEREVIQVIFEKREEACELVLKLSEIIYRYGHATVEDYYDLIGVSQQFRSKDVRGFGWDRLTPGDYTIEYTDGEYTLTLAKAKRL